MTEQKITQEDIRHVARLSRLEFTDEEIGRFTADLNNILAYVDKLNELDTSGVEPTSHALKLQNVFREDVAAPSLTNEEALANAPENEGPFFKVPQIIQEM